MQPPLILPVAEYLPDLPAGAGSSAITNVYPRTPLSYGPIPQPMPQYNALSSRCQGGFATRDSTGNVFIFAGDVANLYMAKTGGGGTWANVSRSPDSYNAGDETWRFIYFNGSVIATDFGDPLQAMALSGTQFADLTGSPPKGRYIAVVKNAFVVLGNTWDAENGYMPQRVWWSGAGDATSWPALGTGDAAQLQSGAVDLLGNGGWVQGFAPDLINADAVVFQQYAVRRMQYMGPPSVFSFLPVENARGCLCPNSIVVSGGIAYYWGQDGIYAFDGAESRPIGANKVDKTIYADVSGNFLSHVYGTTDPLKKLIWWAYPSNQSPDGNPDRLLCYNWQLDRFSLAEISCEIILKLLSIGYTLDELYTVLGYTLDTVPAPLDSEIWQGGRLSMGLFDTEHKVNFLTGPALEATVETQELQPSAGRRWLVTNSRPLIDGDGTTPSVSMGRRERKEDTVSYTSPVALNAMGACGVRTSGRYMRGRITVPAGSNNWGDLSGIELEAVAQGTR